MKKKILKDFVLTEISGVDRPAQPTAKMTIMKRAEEDETVSVITKYYSEGATGTKDFKQALIDNKRQKQLWEAREELYPLFNALQDAITSLVTDVNLSEAGRQTKIEETVNSFMSAVREVMPDIEEELQKTFEDLTKAGSSGKINPDGENMSEELTKKVAELEKALAEKAEALEKAAKDMAEMKAMEEKKKKEMEMKKNDETIVVAGQSIAKSAVGEEQFAVYKALAAENEKMVAEIAKSKTEAEIARLEKRASEEFKHVPGTVTDIAKMLKALVGMEAEVAKSFETVLKSVDEKNAEAFKVHGVSKGAAEGSAEDKLEKRAEEIRKSDSKLTKEQALVKAYEEHPELVAELA